MANSAIAPSAPPFDLNRVNLDLENVRIIGHWPSSPDLQRLQIRHGRVQQILPMAQSAEPSQNNWNLDGSWISLGGVDLQINGALGLAFPDLGPEDGPQLQKIGEYLWQQGIDGYLPTLVTTSVDKIQRSLRAIQQFLSHPPQPNTAQILGVHLEGPFLNPDKRGAHPQEWLLPLTLNHVQRVLGDLAPLVKVITLAPELEPPLEPPLEPGGQVIPYLRSLGIIVSLGHSLATAAQAQAAFDQGASMVTHAFNAMPSLHHREPGLLGIAATRPGVSVGLIADGQHVTPVMVDWLLRVGRYDQGVFLVSDALAPLGLPDGRYPWDSREIEVVHGTARLANGTLSGTTIPLLVGAQNLLQWGLCEPAVAIALATTAPRRAIGLEASLIGAPANLLRWQVDPQTGQQLTWERLIWPETLISQAPDFPVSPEAG